MAVDHLMKRRALLKATVSAALGAGLSSCSTPFPQSGLVHTDKRFVIPEISWDRIIRTVVGLRPFRRSGFRVETERFGEKVVIHNYGHGARGVGMSWGTAHLALEEAMRTGRSKYAVVGCGAVGLATGRLLQRRGFDVTIYAKDLPPHTTSNVAEAQFDPDLLPHDFEDVLSKSSAERFRERYERAARLSHRYYQDMVGDYYGIRWLETYRHDDAEFRLERDENLLNDLYHYKVLKPSEHPFGSTEVVRETTMQIQTPIYLEAVVREFRLAGGRISVREFSDLKDMLDLPEPVIMNCTGLGCWKIPPFVPRAAGCRATMEP